MAFSIKVDTRFHTVHDTARLLGVSEKHAETLVEKAKLMTNRYLAVRQAIKGREEKESATAARKRSEPNAGRTTKPKKDKARS